MTYDTSSIKNISECDVLIDKAHSFKNELDNAISSLKAKLEREYKDPSEIVSNLLLVKEQIHQLQSYLPNLPQGELKRAKEMDLLNLKMKLRQLEKMEQEGSAVFYLEQQLEICRFNAQLSCIDAFILSLARKKAVLRNLSDQAA